MSLVQVGIEPIAPAYVGSEEKIFEDMACQKVNFASRNLKFNVAAKRLKIEDAYDGTCIRDDVKNSHAKFEPVRPVSI